MKDDSVKYEKSPEENIISSPLDDIVRNGAQEMLQKALEVEVNSFIGRYQYILDDRARRLVVRNGYHRPRKIVTGAGQLDVQVPRVDDRVLSKHQESRFYSRIIPPYLRRSKNINELLPVLYLKGISTGDFSEALEAILGKEVIGLSSDVIVRLKQVWQKDYTAWNSRDLSKSTYVYWWVDGIYFNVRLDDERQCILLIIGAKEDGTKEPIAIEDGFRESKESWLSILRDLKRRGLHTGPKLATGDGALGFWSAIDEEYPQARKQRCWVHKTANVLDKMPKSIQAKAKTMLHNIYLAPTKDEANSAFDAFIESYELKYPKAVTCLEKDRQQLLAFYDFPAEHWTHLRTTNPIESTFATVRLRTRKTKGCGSRIATLTMVFKLICSAQKRWYRLRGHKKLTDVFNGIPYKDGVQISSEQPKPEIVSI